ncbi:MAG: glycyl-tRNA synthetase beta chain, partial [Pseudomonadota bacterium]
AQLYRLQERLKALEAFSREEAAISLAAANRRIANLLRKQNHGQDSKVDGQGGKVDGQDNKVVEEGKVDPRWLKEPAELALWAKVCDLQPLIAAATAEHNDAGVLGLLAQARPEVDQFFESIMVMVDDPVLRGNRIALLVQLHEMMNQLADLSALH